MSNHKKVTGIGGIFFKCKDPEKLKEWYNQRLGLPTNQYGAMFEFRTAENPEKPAFLQWSAFKEDTDYFAPSDKQFMINYRVEDLESLVAELQAAGVELVGGIDTYSYGKFAHIVDPEGNKIELWEPVDAPFEESEG